MASNVYTKKKEIGRGSMGVVFLCRDSKDYRYALKEVSFSGNRMTVQHGDFIKTLVRSLREHDNIVNFKEVWYTDSQGNFTDVGWDAVGINWIMEYIMHGNLKTALSNIVPCKQAEIRHIFRQVLLGLNHVHRLGLIWCNLKITNILAADRSHEGGYWLFKIKLSDVDNIRRANCENGCLGYECTRGSSAPEFFYEELRIGYKEIYDQSVDCWSLGYLLHLMLYQTIPFEEEALKYRLENDGGTLFKCRDSAPGPLKELIEGLLQIERSKRLTLLDCVRNAWVSPAQDPKVPSNWVALDSPDVTTGPLKQIRHSAYIAPVKTVLVCREDVNHRFLGSRWNVMEVLQAKIPPSETEVLAMLEQTSQHLALNVEATYGKHILLIEHPSGESTWMPECTSQLFVGMRLCYGSRVEGLDQPTPQDDDFEKRMGSKAQEYTLQCLEFEVPPHLDNYTLGASFHADRVPGAGWLNTTNNFPGLAIVGIIPKDKDGQRPPVFFPSGSDVLRAGDCVLLPRKLAMENKDGYVIDERQAFDLLDPSHIQKLCMDGKAGPSRKD